MGLHVNTGHIYRLSFVGDAREIFRHCEVGQDDYLTFTFEDGSQLELQVIELTETEIAYKCTNVLLKKEAKKIVDIKRGRMPFTYIDYIQVPQAAIGST